MASAVQVRRLPDLEVLPAHGPVAPSSPARVDERLRHHAERLRLCLARLGPDPVTAETVARELPWTRHERTHDSMDASNRGMAALETEAHLDPLVARALSATRVGSASAAHGHPPHVEIPRGRAATGDLLTLVGYARG